MSEEGKKGGNKKERRFSQEQYDMLKRCSEKEDIREWNEWREKNPNAEILLEGADLVSTRLEGANLKYAYMKGARLEGTNLVKAILSHSELGNAVLSNSNLAGANLTGAHLECATFGRACLEGAVLREAYMVGARFRNTHMENTELLKANLKLSTLTQTHLENANLYDANLEAANVQKASLKGARLGRTNLECANLDYANLSDAILNRAHLKNTTLCFTHLKGVKIDEACLEGARLGWAVVDGATVFRKCRIDENTDFRGVGLDSCRIDSGTKQLLEYNIRRKNWEDWYKEHRFLWWPVQAFWAMSDYGMSTLRVIGVFFILALLFAAVYMNWAYWSPPGVVDDLLVKPAEGEAALHYFGRALIRPIYFSVVTMTTLGFGDMYANKDSIAGHVLLILQVILGYVLLGALITRFAVLFTAGGPAGKFARSRSE